MKTCFTSNTFHLFSQGNRQGMVYLEIPQTKCWGYQVGPGLCSCQWLHWVVNSTLPTSQKMYFFCSLPCTQISGVLHGVSMEDSCAVCMSSTTGAISPLAVWRSINTDSWRAKLLCFLLQQYACISPHLQHCQPGIIVKISHIWVGKLVTKFPDLEQKFKTKNNQWQFSLLREFASLCIFSL